MKKLICLLVSALMISALCACNSTGNTTRDEHNHDHTHAAVEQSAQQGNGDEGDSALDTEGADTENTQDAGGNVQEGTNNSSAENTQEDATEYPYTAEATGSLGTKHSNKIDVPFEQALNKAESDEKIVNVCEKFTREWKVVADRYYKEILYYNGSVPEATNFATDKQMHAYIEQRKSEWLSDYNRNVKDYAKKLEKKFTDTDKVEAMVARLEFDMQREFALELIGIYEMLGEYNNQDF